MSAEPTQDNPEGQLPAWLLPPEGGFVAEDLDRLPNLPRHTELIDGSLVFVSPQTNFHSLVVDFLTSELRRQTPYLVRKLLSVMMRAGARRCGQG